jgi:uncharacterized surface anchored protein
MSLYSTGKVVPYATRVRFIRSDDNSAQPYYFTCSTVVTAHGQDPEFVLKVTPFDHYTATPASGEIGLGEVLVETYGTVASAGDLTVTLKDAVDDTPLAGGTYELRDADSNVVETFTTDEQGSFLLDPTSETLAALMPEAGSSVTLTLVETQAPEGYDLDATEHAVTVSMSQSTDDATATTTLAYTFSVDGEATEAATFTNTQTQTVAPTTSQDDQSASNESQAQPAAATVTAAATESLPETGDPLNVTAVAVMAASAGIVLLAATRFAGRQN